MAIKRRKFQLGVRLKPTTQPTVDNGDISVSSVDNKIKTTTYTYAEFDILTSYSVGDKVKYSTENKNYVCIQAGTGNLPTNAAFWEVYEQSIVTEDQTQTLTNKDIDADNNTISNIETDNLKAGVLNTDLSGAATDTEIPSALAVKNALDGQNEASEITYDPSGNPETTATDVQNALDDTGTAVNAAATAAANAQTTADNHIADAADAHTASAITNVPAGNLAATDVQGALNELQTEVDGKANSSEITDHINDPTDAHAASAITNTPSGNLVATDVQGALDELQTDVDTRATSTDLSNHIADTSTHGVTTIAGLDETQTFTNKTLTSPVVNTPNIDGGTATNDSRILLPKDTTVNLDALTDTESSIAYDTTQKAVVFNDGTQWTAVGTGGSGGINYLEGDNSDAENTVGDWTNYRNTTDGELPDDFGGTPDVGYAGTQRSVASPLRGDASFVLDLTMAVEADAQGHGSYCSFVVDSADLAKKLTISFDYDASDVAYNDGDIKVFIYDEDKSQLIRVNGEDLQAGKGTHYAQFQTDAVSDNYRLVLHYAGTSKDFAIKFDNVKVGPRELAKGTIVTDWKEYDLQITASTTNPTKASSPVVDNAVWRRVGDSMEISYRYRHDSNTGATSGTGTYRFSIPAGYTIDTSKFQDVGNMGGLGQVGTCNVYGAAEGILTGTVTVNNYQNLQLIASDDVNVPQTVDESYVDLGQVAAYYSFTASVPIQGWSSNAKMSEDLGGREVVVEGAGNGGTSITANVTNLDFTETEDTTASWDGTQFTAPETGYYLISGGTLFTASGTRAIDAYIDGTWSKRISDNVTTTQHSFSGVVYVEKGNVLTLRSSSSGTLSNNTAVHTVHIQKLASPQTILETETVAARYTSNSGQVIGTTTTNLIFEDLSKDTHNAYNTSTGVYSVPASGWYSISCGIMFIDVGSSWASNEISDLNIRVNGSLLENLDYFQAKSAFSTRYIKLKGSCEIFLEKGDEVTLDTRKTASSQALISSSPYNTFSIARIK